MKHLVKITLAVSLGAALSACSMSQHDDAKPAPMQSGMTQNFVTNASIGDMFEIQSSKVALKKSSDARIRKLAHVMIADHNKSSAKLKATLAMANTHATPATALDEQHQSMLNDLKATPKADFDKAYLDAQESAHDEAIALYRNYSASGDNAKLKQFADKTLPVLTAHKTHVDKLEGM